MCMFVSRWQFLCIQDAKHVHQASWFIHDAHHIHSLLEMADEINMKREGRLQIAEDERSVQSCA